MPTSDKADGSGSTSEPGTRPTDGVSMAKRRDDDDDAAALRAEGDGAGSLDEEAAALRKRDRAFLVRLMLRLGVTVLLGIWIVLQLTSSSIGSCAARGFESVTSEGVPAKPPSE